MDFGLCPGKGEQEHQLAKQTEAVHEAEICSPRGDLANAPKPLVQVVNINQDGARLRRASQ